MPRIVLLLGLLGATLSLTACSRGGSSGSGSDDDDDSAPADDDDATAPPDAYLGFARDQQNNMTVQWSLMAGLWVRVAETGDPEQHAYTPSFGAYTEGLDGISAAGDGDDERHVDVDAGALTFEELSWEPTEQLEAFPEQGYPSPHLPDGSPPVWAEGAIRAGSDAGTWSVRFTHGELGSIDVAVQVMPPDWCLFGDHPKGGHYPGFCE